MVIKELIERELQRKGQVFYLHNRIYSINSVARNIQNQVKGYCWSCSWKDEQRRHRRRYDAIL